MGNAIQFIFLSVLISEFNARIPQLVQKIYEYFKESFLKWKTLVCCEICKKYKRAWN